MSALLALAFLLLLWVACGFMLLSISSALSQPKPIKVNLRNLTKILFQMTRGLP